MHQSGHHILFIRCPYDNTPLVREYLMQPDGNDYPSWVCPFCARQWEAPPQQPEVKS